MKNDFYFKNVMGGGIISCLQLFKAKRYVPLVVVLILHLVLILPLHSQIDLCNSDIATSVMMSNHPGMQQQIQIDEGTMQEDMQSNPQAIMNNVTYTIPIVFHILHKGEAEGTGSNISRAQVLQALADLNSEFINTGIQWCLAQQDPDGNSQYDAFGNNITGIRRVNASGIPNFSNFGIWSGVNEVQAKALSNWPEDDYTEVWVAHRLYVAGKDAAGFAYFPVAEDDIDGMALRADATGISASSKIFAHEAGHYLSLYHTFHEATNTSCPPNSDCNTQGDMICDTRAHKTFPLPFFPFPCDESQYTSCDPGFSQPYLVTQNHMNYTNNNCRVQFTPKQDMRMRCALMSLRGSLLNSVGCIEGCPNAVANFTFPNTTIGIGTTVDFTNTSSGASTFEWSLNGDILSNTTNWTFQFSMGGNFIICLDAFGSNGCVKRLCKEISVIPHCIPANDSCEKVQNGDFEQIAPGLDVNNFQNVCGWKKIQSSPFFCDGIINNALGFFFDGDLEGHPDNERVTSTQSLDLQVGEKYKISFDYLVTKASPDKIIIALAENNTPASVWSPPLEASAAIIATVINPAVAYSSQSNNQCYNANFVFQHFETTFMVLDTLHKFLTITGEGSSVSGPESIVFIDNVSIKIINCSSGNCNTEPYFTFDPDCPREFNGFNAGDGNDYTWNFLCNGISMTGKNVTIDLPPGPCQVCLSVACDQESGETICKTVIVPQASEQCPKACQPLTIPLQTCEQDTSQSNKFIANFSVSVPNGYGPCSGSGVISGSQSMDIDLVSMSTIDDVNNSANDIITIGLEVTTPPGFDLTSNPVAGTINLCDSIGNVLCYTLTFTGSTCDQCLGEITATAACADPNPFDDVFVYEGSVTVTLPPLQQGESYSICDPVSTEVGYEQDVSFGNNQASINFFINTSTEGDFEASSLLCIKIGEEQYCYTLNIEIDSCVVPPIDCLNKWDTKSVSCTRSQDGTLTYNFAMSPGMIGSGIYHVCDSGVHTTLTDKDDHVISGGTAVVNVGFQSGLSFVFDVDINVPCEYEGGIINLRLYFCDDAGNLTCYLFPLYLQPCVYDCDRDEGGPRSKLARPYDKSDSMVIYPNPAADDVHIVVINPSHVRHVAEVTDAMGRRMIFLGFASGVYLDTDGYADGVYFVRVIADDGRVVGTEKFLIAK